MVQYICENCDKEFNKLSNYNTHKNRKNKCKKPTPKLEDIHKLKSENRKLRKDFDELKEIINNMMKENLNKNTTININANTSTIHQNISNIQTEQKALNNRLNALETFIIKNININNDFINDELQNGGAIEGLQFENQLSNELKKYNINVYFDKEITKKYGKSSAGVDIIVKNDDKLITLQCKREIKSGSLKDVNHFIRGSQIIEKKENIKPKLYWISKVAPNKSALESLKLDNITIITDINSKNCLKKCIDNIKKDMDINNEILKN
jgi:hypothetical protein